MQLLETRRLCRVVATTGLVALSSCLAGRKAAGSVPRRVRVGSCKCLNSLIEQDHRRIKQRIRPMLGFKRFETAAVTIRGIESAEKIKKHQFNLETLAGKIVTVPAVRAIVLAA